MPAIGDLNGTRQSSCSRLSVTTAAITSQYPDLRMISKPGGNCRHFSVRQQRHDPPPLKIADDRSIAMIAAKGPVIDARGIDSFSGQAGSASNHPQQCVVADRHHQPLGETGGGSAAKRQSEMVDDALQTRRPAATCGDGVIIEAFSENPSSAGRLLANEAPGDEPKSNPSAGTWQV
jgi:hypothetical protein